MTHPGPPRDLESRELLLHETTGPWFRIHRVALGALYFGQRRDASPPANRFDSPDGAFGVLYAGEDLACAFVETFAHSLESPQYVTEEELALRAYSEIRSRRALRLVDLTGEGLARLRADANLTTMDDYAVPQAWSQALHLHPASPDGLRYRARHDPNRISVALFEHVEAKLRLISHGALDEPANRKTLAPVLKLYKFEVLPREVTLEAGGPAPKKKRKR